ncbi:hypothetical protein [Prescottella agglutinans]|uniref:Uncharacterized protein n=1 Tax=Prescottella agglutinans TaxID=1644129 RepID=A0ABT6M9J5_9NOCA|nr:hypothetical protein [Prescottella agglutinans]MDH6280983.1 hypothetical protein [Prescottella agglutinans]
MTTPRHTLTPEQAEELRRAITSAEMLRPPTISSEDETGLVLDVATVGVSDTGFVDGSGHPYVRCTDGKYFRLPEALRDWATASIAEHRALVQTGNGKLFPSSIEFGVFNGGMYAQYTDV